MVFFSKLFGKKDKTFSSETSVINDRKSLAEATTLGTKVSNSRIWKCPKCGTVLEKSSYGSVFRTGEPLPENYQGTSTCQNCGTVSDWRDVYSGRYDPEEKAKIVGKIAKPPKQISVVAFLLGSRTSPTEVKKYAQKILEAKYPGSQVHKHYLIGRLDDNMTENEALVQYNDYVRTGDLPKLGEQFDSHICRGPDGTKVVALYFKP